MRKIFSIQRNKVLFIADFFFLQIYVKLKSGETFKLKANILQTRTH